MEGKHIQLPYGVLSDDEPKNLLHLIFLQIIKETFYSSSFRIQVM